MQTLIYRTLTTSAFALVLLLASPAHDASARTGPLPTAQSLDQERVEACSLLSSEQIEAITHARPTATKPSAAGVVSTCQWTADQPFANYPVVSLTVMPQPQTNWDSFMQNLIDGEMEEVVRSGERVDVGRFGLYDERVLVVATAGGSTLMLTVSPPFRPATGRDGVLALARAVLDKLR